MVRSPYRSCIAMMLKGWTFESSDGRPRGKQGKESRKLGGREEGEPPEAEEGGGKPREGGRNTRGEAEKSRQGNWDRWDGNVGEVGVEESGLRAEECRYWARRPSERTMVKSLEKNSTPRVLRVGY